MLISPPLALSLLSALAQLVGAKVAAQGPLVLVRLLIPTSPLSAQVLALRSYRSLPGIPQASWQSWSRA